MKSFQAQATKPAALLAAPQVRSLTILCLVMAALAVTARLVPGPRTIDDAFITFRYARNILAGNGFVYNPGERVLGTTTPLYTFLLVLLASLSGGAQAPFPQIALGINALADAGVCLLLIWLGRRLKAAPAGVAAALVWAILPFSVTFAIGGLETSVYVLLLTGAVCAHLSGRHKLAALTGALCVLTRPDALILIGPLALDRLITWLTRFRQRPKPPRSGDHSLRSYLVEASAFILPLLAWTVFSTVYFGSPLPHSVTAKTVAYHLQPNEAFIRLLQHYATPFQEDATLGAPIAVAAGLIIYPFLFLIGARWALKQNKHTWPWVAYPWFYFATFAIAHPLIFRWYLTPPLPAYILLILMGVERMIRDLLRLPGSGVESQNRAPRWRSAFLALLLAIPCFLVLNNWAWRPDHGLVRPAPKMAWYQIELLYRQVAGELQPEIQAHQGKQPVLAAGDVGVLGFFSSARILDTVGLNSPVSTRYYPLDPALYTINYAIPPQLILDQKPDYLVILEVYGREGLLKDPRFWNLYQLRQKIPTDIYDSDGMLVFQRRAVP